MLRINNYRMNLSLNKVGFIRSGYILCPICGGEHIDEIRRAIRRHEADVLYDTEAAHQFCDQCGMALVREPVAA